MPAAARITSWPEPAADVSHDRFVLLRHGESTWNKENRFTGWTDVDLSDKGREEARAAGRLLREAGFVFDVAYTSVLKRAIRTCWIALDELDLLWVPVSCLVAAERAALRRAAGPEQGRDRREAWRSAGQVWRRSYDIPPPPLASTTRATRPRSALCGLGLTRTSWEVLHGRPESSGPHAVVYQDNTYKVTYQQELVWQIEKSWGTIAPTPQQARARIRRYLPLDSHLTETLTKSDGLIVDIYRSYMLAQLLSPQPAEPPQKKAKRRQKTCRPRAASSFTSCQNRR